MLSIKRLLWLLLDFVSNSLRKEKATFVNLDSLQYAARRYSNTLEEQARSKKKES